MNYDAKQECHTVRWNGRVKRLRTAALGNNERESKSNIKSHI